VAEFSSAQNGLLNYDEFLNMFLPSSDYNLRHCNYYVNPKTSPFNAGGLTPAVPQMASRILSREVLFHC